MSHALYGKPSTSIRHEPAQSVVTVDSSFVAVAAVPVPSPGGSAVTTSGSRSPPPPPHAATATRKNGASLVCMGGFDAVDVPPDARPERERRITPRGRAFTRLPRATTA